MRLLGIMLVVLGAAAMAYTELLPFMYPPDRTTRLVEKTAPEYGESRIRPITEAIVVVGGLTLIVLGNRQET